MNWCSSIRPDAPPYAILTFVDKKWLVQGCESRPAELGINDC
jgi:hypothetical protein